MFWSINRAHQSDIGGSTHGAYNAGATEIWQEGIRVTPLRLYDRGVVRRDVLEMLVTNVRHPHDFRGDLAAMIGSAHVGERRMLALAGEFGWDTTHAAIEAVLDGAERQARAVIATWKDGVYHGEAFLDDDGHGYTDIHIRATVTKRGSDLIVDLSDSHEQVMGFVNSSYPEHALGGGGGAGLSDRSAHAEERRRVPPAGGDRQARHGGVGERGRAGDAVHQPLRRRRSSRRSSRRWRPPVPTARWPAGDGASASPSRAAIRARRNRSSGTCSRRAPAAAPRRWATAGRRAASGRRPAASSSAAWR